MGVPDDILDDVVHDVEENNDVEDLRFQLQLKDAELESLHDEVWRLKEEIN